ncbi:MAG: hypothetical protein BWK76_13480 [Desulfobulbaceae bacterium A2]|nr:MAG: hypothetical protein BWK76_13480 [Desulfobulbaceae bacterium A2]
MQRLGELIRYHRKRSALTQAELAELAGVGKNLVHELEKGRHNVRLDKLLPVLQVLNITLDFSSPLRESFLREYPDAHR